MHEASLLLDQQTICSGPSDNLPVDVETECAILKTCFISLLLNTL
jgi:hypothetical protein